MLCTTELVHKWLPWCMMKVAFSGARLYVRKPGGRERRLDGARGAQRGAHVLDAHAKHGGRQLKGHVAQRHARHALDVEAQPAVQGMLQRLKRKLPHQ